MLVMATCVERSWDSRRCVMYRPGEVCEIDSESPLANMTKKPLNPADPPRRPEYCFEFDRALAARRKSKIA